MQLLSFSFRATIINKVFSVHSPNALENMNNMPKIQRSFPKHHTNCFSPRHLLRPPCGQYQERIKTSF